MRERRQLGAVLATTSNEVVALGGRTLRYCEQLEALLATTGNEVVVLGGRTLRASGYAASDLRRSLARPQVAFASRATARADGKVGVRVRA